MSQLQDRIAQFRKMATDDPDNELGHYRLGQLLMEDGQFEDAVRSFRRTLMLSPQFSKVYQLLGQSLIQLGRRDEAIQELRTGFAVADERGDNMPRDEMARMLAELGEPVPEPRRGAGPTQEGPAVPIAGAFCQRARCDAFKRVHSQQLPAPPFNDELGRKIYEKVCSNCWNDWKLQGVKVINELRLDLSTDRGQEEYDRYMREYLGLDE
jgi:Fe-S cluster biosynthesis and repair protein YggX